MYDSAAFSRRPDAYSETSGNPNPHQDEGLKLLSKRANVQFFVNDSEGGGGGERTHPVRKAGTISTRQLPSVLPQLSPGTPGCFSAR